MKKYFLLLFIILLNLKLTSQRAIIYEELKEMSTYPYGDPDPVPKPGKIYPYYRFDAYSVDPVQQEWNMVCMENDWIKLWIAPEIGGKVYGAMDKTNGKYFIYYNNVVKFRDIAMRGPWTSGGIEMNFGCIGHSPVTSSTVDYYMRLNPDSSVSCFIGAIDLPGRTEWKVEIYLPANKAWFETRAEWINPSSAETSLYHWMNASADAAEDLHYYFPGTNQIDHSGNVYQWPVNKNERDISLYRNNNFGGDHSYHVLGKYTDWFAGYYDDRDYGFGHWSLYPLKPGKKIWMWALSRQGAIWESLLTDTAENSQYTEIQTGLLYNQAGSASTYSPFKHLEFEQGSELLFTDRWFPLSNISGLTTITSNIALNITSEGESKKVLIYALNIITDTIELVTKAGNTISRLLDMEPTDTVTLRINNAEGISEIYLRNKEELIYRGNDHETILARPLEDDGFKWNSAYGYYYQAIEYMRQRDYLMAGEYIRKCIDEDQYFMPAYTKQAELEMRKHRYDKAEKLVRKVLAFDAYDPEANNIYASLTERQGKLYQAKDAYGIAMRSNKFHNYSINKLALLSLRENNIAEARKYIDYALKNGINNKQIKRTRLVWARKAGLDSLFTVLYNDIISHDPLNHFARFENYLMNPADSLEESFLKYINNEFPYQTFLEMACRYINYYMYTEALKLLQLSPPDPLIFLYLSYVYDKLGKDELSDKYLNELIQAETDFVFPFRAETEHILNWAAEKNNSWKIRYYQALIYWNSGNREKADCLFRSVGDEPGTWEFYIARGNFTLADDDKEAGRDYREAYKIAPGEWRTNHELVNFYLSGGYTSRALKVSTTAYEKFKGNYIIDFDHARCLLSRDSVYRCIDVLKETVILPHEGAHQGREVWEKANALASLDSYCCGRIDEAYDYIGEAYRWTENLGVGKPYNVDERILDFVKAMVVRKKGESEQARDLYEKIINQCTYEYECIDSYNILKVFALRETNNYRESESYFNEWIKGLADKRIRQWAVSLYKGRYEEAEKYAYMMPDILDKEPWQESIYIADLSLLHKVVKIYLQEKW